MNPFKLSIPEINRSLTIEPLDTVNTYKIYDDTDPSFPDSDNEESELELEEISDNPMLGVLHINNAKDFTFEGQGLLSGDDLRFLVGFLIKHPSFQPNQK